MNQKYEVQPIKKENTVAVAKTYAKVFAEEPWNEVSRCPKCGSFSPEPPATKKTCSCGSSFSEEAYPLVETTQYINQEISKPDAVSLFLTQAFWVNQMSQNAQGFGWGFQMEASELAQKKYRTEQMKQLIAELLVNTGVFYYVSEVGVLPELQGLGFGKKITEEVITGAERKGYREFVVRTNEDSAMRYILEKIGMKAIIGLQTGRKDTENEARVLFVGQK